MDQPLQHFWQSLRDPHALHAILVHLPLAGGILALLLVGGLVLTLGRSASLRWVTVAFYAALAVGSVLAMNAGEAAAEDLGGRGPTLAAPAADVLHTHEELGEKVWVFMAVAGVCAALTAIPLRPVRVLFLVLTVGAALAAAGWVGATGFYGGTLVYDYGVGVPDTPLNLPP